MYAHSQNDGTYVEGMKRTSPHAPLVLRAVHPLSQGTSPSVLTTPALRSGFHGPYGKEKKTGVIPPLLPNATAMRTVRFPPSSFQSSRQVQQARKEMNGTRSTTPLPRVRRPKLNIWASWKKEEEKRQERLQEKNRMVGEAPVARMESKSEEGDPKRASTGEGETLREQQGGNNLPAWVSDPVIAPPMRSSLEVGGRSFAFSSLVRKSPVGVAPVVGWAASKDISARDTQSEEEIPQRGPHGRREKPEGEKETCRQRSLRSPRASWKPLDAHKETKWPPHGTAHPNAQPNPSLLLPSSPYSSFLPPSISTSPTSFPRRHRSSSLLEEEKDALGVAEETEEDRSLLQSPSIIKVVDELPPSFRDFDAPSSPRARRRRIPREPKAATNPTAEKHQGLRTELQKLMEGETASALASPFLSFTSPAVLLSSFTSRSLKSTPHSGRREPEGSGRVLGSKEQPKSSEEKGWQSERLQRQRWRFSSDPWTPHVVSDLHATLTGSPHSTFERLRSSDGSTTFSKSNPATDSYLRSFGTSLGFPGERTRLSFPSTLNLNDTLGRAERAEMLDEVAFDDDAEGISKTNAERLSTTTEWKRHHSAAQDAALPHRLHHRGERDATGASVASASSSVSSLSPPTSGFLSTDMEALKAAVRWGDALAEDEAEEEAEGIVEWSSPRYPPPSVALCPPPSQRRETAWQRRAIPGGALPSSSSPASPSPTATGPPPSVSITATGKQETHFPFYASSTNASHPLAFTQQMQPSVRTMAAIARLGGSPPALTQKDLTEDEGLSVARLRRWFGPSTLLRRFRYKRHNGLRVDREDGGHRRSPSRTLLSSPDHHTACRRDAQEGGVTYVDDQCSVWSEASVLWRDHPSTDRISRMEVSCWEDSSFSSPSPPRGGTRSPGSSSDSLSMAGIQTSPLGRLHRSPSAPKKKKKTVRYLDDYRHALQTEGNGEDEEAGEKHTLSSSSPPVVPKRVHPARRQPPLPRWKWKKNAKGEKVIVADAQNLLLLDHYTKYGKFPSFFDAEKTPEERDETKEELFWKTVGMKGACALEHDGAALLYHAVENGMQWVRQKALEKPKESAAIRMVRHWCDRCSVEKNKMDGSVVEDPRRAHDDVMVRVIMEEERARSVQHFSRLRYREKIRLESQAARGGVWKKEEGCDASPPENCRGGFGGVPMAFCPLDHPYMAGPGDPSWTSAGSRRGMDDAVAIRANPFFAANVLASHKELCCRLNPFDIPPEEREKYTHEFVSLHPHPREDERVERSHTHDSEDNVSTLPLSRNSFSSSMIGKEAMDFSHRSSLSRTSPLLSPLGVSSHSTATPASFLSVERDVACCGGGGGLPSPMETALLDLLLHALVESSVWGNPSEPYNPRFPCTSLMEKDIQRTVSRLSEVFLKKPVGFTDLCQLSELHAALAMVRHSMDVSHSSDRTPPSRPGSGRHCGGDGKEKEWVLPLPVRAAVAPSGCPVFLLDSFHKEKSDSTGFQGMVQSTVEVLPLHLTFLLRHPLEEGGNPFRCCLAVDVLHLFHQLPSIFAHHLVRYRGGGAARNPFYAIRMPQWCKSMWYRVMIELKSELVTAYVEEATRETWGRTGGNLFGISDGDRIVLQQQLLGNCVLETFELDRAYCLALSRWRVGSLKQLANAQCRAGLLPAHTFPFSPSLPPAPSGAEMGVTPPPDPLEWSAGSTAEKDSSHGREGSVPSWTAPETSTRNTSTASVVHASKTRGKELPFPPSATNRPRSSANSSSDSATTEKKRMKGIHEKNSKRESTAGLPVAPGPRVYYPLDMQTLYVTASLALEQNNMFLFPRITQLRARYEELTASFSPTYFALSSPSRSSSSSSSSSRGRSRNSGEVVGLPRAKEWNHVENLHFGLATALQQWSVVQKILDTENSYQLCLQQIYLHELSINNFNAHVVPYNTYRAKESIVWGALYRSGLRLAYALCVYLESKPLYCMPDSFTVFFYPLAQFAGCAGGYREMKANLKAVKTSISERCRRVSLAVEMMTVDAAEKLLQEAVEVLNTQCQTASEVISCQAVEEDVLTTSISLVPLPEKTFLEVDLLTE